ncbi:hypothetical protein BU24DRAFT_415050 [Aaosphaeria arxii CBS 175.79]|uniref:Uncharacterized protein n=1 Tax=Aaosphaeria arxii CBS 175.79 TaxID=1450172 RepID=A0A6A5XA10_9PLEO|nr:uncharacterized protein BU24DRAFT_415050 [Aaosphaeria arxii CBS 175.79]KAF2009749.1 hypothetical protein BU24DRAFT_415050 [Aaosphaeria arxii CBS 175.79]
MFSFSFNFGSLLPTLLCSKGGKLGYDDYEIVEIPTLETFSSTACSKMHAPPQSSGVYRCNKRTTATAPTTTTAITTGATPSDVLKMALSRQYAAWATLKKKTFAWFQGKVIAQYQHSKSMDFWGNVGISVAGLCSKIVHFVVLIAIAAVGFLVWNSICWVGEKIYSMI